MNKDVKNDLAAIAKNAVFSATGNVVGRALNVATQIFIARALGPAAYGFYAIGWSILRISGVFIIFGLNRTVLSYGVVYWKKNNASLNKVLHFAIGLTLFISFIYSLTLYYSANLLAEHFFRDSKTILTIQTFALIIPLQALLWVGDPITRITKDSRYSILSLDITQPILNILILIVLYQINLGYTGVLIAIFLSFFAATVLILFFIKNIFQDALKAKISREPSNKELLIYSAETTLPLVFGAIIPWVDRFVLSAILPARDIGIYQSASQLSIIFSLVLGSINAVFAPIVVDAYSKKQIDRLNTLYKITTKWGLYIAIPIGIVILISPQAVLGVLFGKDYTDGSVALQILTIGQLANVGTGSVNNLMLLTGHTKPWSFITLIALFLSVTLNFVLSPSIGILGAAIGTTSATIIMFALGILELRRHLRLWPYDKRFLKSILSFTITIVVTSLIKGYISTINDWYQILIISLISVICFTSCIILLGLDEEDKQIIQTAIKKYWHKGI